MNDKSKQDQIRELVIADSQKEKPTLADEYGKVVKDIPEWQDNDIANQEKAKLHGYAGHWGMTQNEVLNISPEQVVGLRNNALLSQDATALNKKGEAAVEIAALKNRGVPNKEQVLSELAQLLPEFRRK